MFNSVFSVLFNGGLGVNLLFYFIVLSVVLSVSINFYIAEKNDAIAEEWHHDYYKVMAAVCSVIAAVIVVIFLPTMIGVGIMSLITMPFETVIVLEIVFLGFALCDIEEVFDFDLLK